MKKATLLMVFLLVIACFVYAHAENEAAFAVESTAIPAGSTGTVTVQLTVNPGVAGFTGTLLYDHEKLAITKVEVFEFSDMVFAVNTDNGQFGGLSMGGDSTGTGAMFRVTFQASGEAEPSETQVSVSVEKCGNYKRESVAAMASAGTVTITEKMNKLPGDVNSDGKVDGRDLLRLARYIAGNSIAIDEAASDVNGDSRVDGRDILRLARYLAGQNVELK